MSIRLITGLPGAGKSLRAVDAIRVAGKAGRNVYVDGLDGLQPFGWDSCDVNRWQDLPDGSLVVVDEAQKRWPTRRTGEPPDYIAALSEHRHRGFDFILITQHPTMLDSYVRKLVDTHEHLVRQFKAQVARIYTWQECYDDPQSLATRQRSQGSLWKYPSECFALYKSATIHTVKSKIPKRLLVLPLLVVVGCGLGWYAMHSVKSIKETPVGSSSARGSFVPDGRSAAPGSAAEYLYKLTPRVAGMPWSAPVFDDHKPKAEPEIYCAIVEGKDCRCYSEQITPIGVKPLECREIALHGVYNPYREPMKQIAQRSSAEPEKGREKRPQSVSQTTGGPSSPDGADAARGLKAGVSPDAGEDWPRPDFSYKVPFPVVGSGRH